MREIFEQFAAAVRALGRVIRRFCDELGWFFRKHLRPVLHELRCAQARQDWYEAQQTARLLSRHPDLSELDGWLDAYYLGFP